MEYEMIDPGPDNITEVHIDQQQETFAIFLIQRFMPVNGFNFCLPEYAALKTDQYFVRLVAKMGVDAHRRMVFGLKTQKQMVVLENGYSGR